MNEDTEYYIYRIIEYTRASGNNDGVEKASRFLLEQSGKLFSEEKDELAKLYRALSKDILEIKIDKEKLDKLNSKDRHAWQMLDQAIQNEQYPEEDEEDESMGGIN